MVNEKFDSTNPESLAGLWSLADDTDPQWSDEDLGEMFRHQLDTELELDLSRLASTSTDDVATLTAAGRDPLRTFGDLLHHPRPPLELLKMTKQYMKDRESDRECRLPTSITRWFYFVAILLARWRHDTRITRLDDELIRDGIEWSLGRPWLDESIRRLLEEARQAVGL